MLLLLAALLQSQSPGPDGPQYSSVALSDFVAAAARSNSLPPSELAGYRAEVESEIALILRDSLGRELVGQIEQLAARASWQRSGRYDLHVVGFRSQSLGAPYSALTWTRMWTVPTLYGNRLLIGLNEGIGWQDSAASARTRGRSDSVRRGRQRRDTLREPFRVIHPLATDRDRYYRFRGGDTVAVLHQGGRSIPIMRVDVEPISTPRSNFVGFRGELDFDATRRQLVRMRGRLQRVGGTMPALMRASGAVSVAFIEFENAEVLGRYWLPAFQWSEFHAQLGVLGETRPVFRIISRFRDFSVSESTVTLTGADSAARMSPTRARLTFASKDSISRFGDWQSNLGSITGAVSADAFADVTPDVWSARGRPRVDYFPRRFQELTRYNRVEGLFTGGSAALRFRDLAPGLTARAHGGIAWTQQAARGGVTLSLQRRNWTTAVRGERVLASTNDFLLDLESGLSIGPLLSGMDDHDYVDRRLAAISATRILGNANRAFVSSELAFVSDRNEPARLEHAVFHRSAFLPNRVAWVGAYLRSISTIAINPNVSGGSLSSGIGARLRHEAAAGDLSWQRTELALAARRYWRGLIFAARADAGLIVGDDPPPQSMLEIGGGTTLPSYGYKEFGGDRAAIGRAGVGYHFPVLRTPLRFSWLVLPGPGPGLATGFTAGWAEASTDAARRAMLAMGGDGITPLSRPSEGVRATADFRFTLFSGLIGFGYARPIDRAGAWEPFFVWGSAF